MGKLDFSLILPAYNEGPTFEKSVGKIISELNKTKNDWEIIFVEDKSSDRTKASVEKFVETNKRFRAIFHKKNLGRGQSVVDGIKLSKAPICGYMDVDCEVAPTYIPLFLKEVKNGTDLVVGKRFYEKEYRSLTRFISSKVYARLIKLIFKLPVSDTECGYKFFNRKKIVKVLPDVLDKGWFWDTEICAVSYWKGLKISEIPVLFIKRREKKSTVKLVPGSIDYLKKAFSFYVRNTKNISK